MPSIPQGSGSGRYIIRAYDSKKLVEFVDSLDADSGIELIDLIGPAGQPHTAVVAMSPDKAAALAQHFRTTNQLTIEPDRPLSLFGGSQDGRFQWKE
jgi:hypothetical protein